MIGRVFGTMNIRIYLTGRVGIAVGSELVVGERQFRDRQGRRVFAYLACCRSRPVSHAELAQLVWPDEMPGAWRTGLSALISRIRSLLACDALKSRGVSLTGGFGQYQLVLPADTWVDLEAASSAIDEAEGALRMRDPQSAFGHASVVHAIANRPFLSGDDGPWVEEQRRTLERQFLRALDCLSQIWLSTGQPTLAVETATRALQVDPYRESSCQSLIQAHAACGNRAGAIRAYHRFRLLLAEDLGTEPLAETEALFLELLA
ncbi:MAG: hypothetical protein HY675_10805 [Chloroflexi bacterium]|nr:hypothetical protein [Chloroflexota bacterium]